MKKTRRSGTDTLDFMREKLERDFQLKEEEMKEKRKERETQRAEQQKLHEQHSNMLQQMQLQQLNQRQQTQDMLSMFAQQSQQQNQTVLAILEKNYAKVEHLGTGTGHLLWVGKGGTLNILSLFRGGLKTNVTGATVSETPVTFWSSSPIHPHHPNP